MSAGAAGVICKSMGFSGTSSSSKCNGGGCGNAAPGVSELSCTGAESEPLACPHQAGDDVFCAASESLVVACTGDGETQGRHAKEAPTPSYNVNERRNLLLKLPKCSHVSRQRRARLLLAIAQFICYLCLVSKSSRAPRCTAPERIAFLLKLPKCSYVPGQPADFLQGFYCCRVLYWGAWGAHVCSCDLLHGWIKVGWPLRIDILSGFTHAEFSAGT